MKKTVLILATLLLTVRAHAYGFNANANVYMDRTSATVEVTNNTYTRIICSGRAAGMTMNGNYLYAYMNNVVIYPGQYSNLYIYTNNFDPFRTVQPNITCRSI